MNLASATVPRARSAIPWLVVSGALVAGSLSGALASLDATAWIALAAIGGAALIGSVGIGRLDLLLLAVNVAAIALLPDIRHRDPLDAGRPNPFYDWTFLRVTAPELLALAAIVAEFLRRRSGSTAPRVGATPLLAIGCLSLGLLIGLLRGNELASCLRDGRKLAYVALAHWLVVRVADEPSRRRTLVRVLLAALAARALVAIGQFLADQGFHYRGFLRSSVDVGDYLGFLALIFVPAAQLRARAVGRGERALLGLLVLLGSAATLTTFSRAAWCAAPIGIAVLLFAPVRCARPSPRWLTALVLLAAVAAPLAFGGLAERAVARVAPLLQPSGDSSVSYRLRELRGAAAIAADHPIAGIGFGTRFDAGGALVDRRRGSETLVHNLFLWSAVKAGGIGLALIAAILALAAAQLLRAARGSADPGAAGGALGLLALLAAFVVMGLVGAMLNQSRVAFALGLLTGLAQSLGPPASSPAVERRR